MENNQLITKQVAELNFEIAGMMRDVGRSLARRAGIRYTLSRELWAMQTSKDKIHALILSLDGHDGSK